MKYSSIFIAYTTANRMNTFGEYKKGELLDLSVFPDEVRNAADDNWGEPVSMENDFSIEEILDMPTEGEVRMNLTNIDCVGHNDLCKVVSPNYSDSADNESHDNSSHGIFCVTGKDSDYIDIDDLY